MNPLQYLQYDVWPRLRVRGRYFLLALRYGGLRRIPHQVIARELEKSVERMERNLKDALRAMPGDVDEEEKKLLLTAIGRSEEMKRTVETMQVGDNGR